MSRGLRAGRAAISGIALVLALLLSLLVDTPAHAAGGTLAGTLTGPNGARFEYFRVDLYQAAGPDSWQLATSRTITSWDTGLPVGDFAIALPAGTYRACFTALTFETVDGSGHGCWQGAYDVFGATDIVVTEGGTTTITPQLPREARVRGRIVGPGGVPITAYVAPYRRAPNGTWEMQFGAQSIADGSYAITDLDPGTYRFCVLDVPREFLAECWDDAASVATATDVTVLPGSAPIVSFWLSRRATISGTVTPPAGSTGSISVSAYWHRNGRWESVAYGSVGPDGGYRITGLDAATYRVCAYGYDVVARCWRGGTDPADATDIVLATSQARAGVNLTLGPAGYVTGTLPEVYLGAQGYPNVTAWRHQDGGWEAVSVGEAVPTGVGNDWSYNVGSLPTGSYVVCVEHQDPEFVPAFPHTCNGGSPSPQGGEPFAVTAGATTSGIDIVTGRGGEIRGKVTAAPRVRVDLYAPTGRLALSQITTPRGLYRFGALPAGDYKVAFHRAPATTTLAAEWWRNRRDPEGLAGATHVTVNGEIVSGISATLDPGGVITGRLVDSTGTAVPGCLVQARGADGGLAVRRAVSDPDGHFAIGGLSTAPYVALVPKGCRGSTQPLYYDADAADHATPRFRDADPVPATISGTIALAGDVVVAP